MTNTHVQLFDAAGILLPIKDEHMCTPPNPFRSITYTQMSLPQLIQICTDSTATSIDLFMELHRRASAHVFRTGSCFYWDCIPVDFVEGEENLQLERARVIMTYDAKWKTGRAPENPSVIDLGTRDTKVEPVYHAVRSSVNAVIEQAKRKQSFEVSSNNERWTLLEDEKLRGQQTRKLTMRNPDQD
jgi:hypothetical protein